MRVVTDILWIEKMRDWKVGSVRRLYYSLLILFTVWSAITARWGTAMTLFQALGVVASLVLALGAVQILLVNTGFYQQNSVRRCGNAPLFWCARLSIRSCSWP